MMASRRSWLALLAATVLTLGAGTAPAAAQNRDILVFAAASLKNALDEAAAQWQRESGKKVVISYAASNTLIKQIEQGAPADMFISADLDWMDYGQQKGLIKPDTRSNLLGNRLVLVAPKDSNISANIQPGFDLAALLKGGRLAMGNVDAVPAGKYGKASLEKLGAWDGVKDKIAQAESVRAALLLVARGEAPLGIVYQTDAAADPTVKIVGTFPENTHPPIIYPIALTKNSTNPDALAFLNFIRSAGCTPDLRASGLYGARRRAASALDGLSGRHDQGRADGMNDLLNLSPEEWTAVRLSIRVATVAMLASLPVGIAVAYAAGARALPRKVGRQRHRAAAAHPAAGRHRLSAPPQLRPARPDRRVPGRAFRDRVLLSLDRRGARLRGDGLSAAGPGDPPVDRSRRSPPGRRRRHARRQPALGVHVRHLAADPAGDHRRHDPVLRQGDGRIRRDHHFRLEYSRRDPDVAVGDLHPDPDSRRRDAGRCVSPWCRSSSRWGRSSSRNCWRGGSTREYPRNEPRGRRHAPVRVVPAGGALRLRWPADGVFRPLRLGQDLADQYHRRRGPPRSRPDRPGRHGAGGHRREHCSFRNTAGASVMYSRRGVSSRISRCGRTCCSGDGSRRRASATSASTRCSTCSTSDHFWIAAPAACRAAKSSALRSAAPCSRRRACC